MGNNISWEEVRLFNAAVEGLNAMGELVGESPKVILSSSAITKWEATEKMVGDFYELDIQERLYESGMATRPTTEGKVDE